MEKERKTTEKPAEEKRVILERLKELLNADFKETEFRVTINYD